MTKKCFWKSSLLLTSRVSQSQSQSQSPVNQMSMSPVCPVRRHYGRRLYVPDPQSQLLPGPWCTLTRWRLPSPGTISPHPGGHSPALSQTLALAQVRGLKYTRGCRQITHPLSC